MRFLQFCLMFCGVFLLSCGQTEATGDVLQSVVEGVDTGVSPLEYAFMVDVDPITMDPTITLPDGSVTHSYDVYAERVAALYESNSDAEISVIIGGNLATKISTELGIQAPTNTIGNGESEPLFGPYYLGNYVLTGGLGYCTVFTNSCGNRSGNAYKIRLNTLSGAQIFDLKTMVWRDGTRGWCGAMYESVSFWNTCTCSNTLRDWVYSSLYTAAIKVGLTAATATVIEYIMAPVVIGAFAL